MAATRALRSCTWSSIVVLTIGAAPSRLWSLSYTFEILPYASSTRELSEPPESWSLSRRRAPCQRFVPKKAHCNLHI